MKKRACSSVNRNEAKFGKWKSHNGETWTNVAQFSIESEALVEGTDINDGNNFNEITKDKILRQAVNSALEFNEKIDTFVNSNESEC